MNGLVGGPLLVGDLGLESRVPSPFNPALVISRVTCPTIVCRTIDENAEMVSRTLRPRVDATLSTFAVAFGKSTFGE